MARLTAPFVLPALSWGAATEL